MRMLCMSKKTIGLILLSLLLLLTACQKDDSSSSSAKKKSNQEAGSGDVYPLTGLDAKSNVDDRITAVMINNHTKARPQTGLSKADIVFEILAEGDITRFLAMYQSEIPDVVGPVRSAREYYFNLADDYGALYVYHGAAKFVDKMIKDEGVDYINGALHDNDGVLFKRSTDRKAPHNSYLQLNAVKDEAKKQGYKTTMDYKSLPFKKKGDKVEGSDATHVKIHYSNEYDAYNPEYHYDNEKQVYTRYAGGEQTVEKEDSAPVEVSNLFVIETAHEVFDNEGRRKVDLKSGGTAYLFQQGKMQTLEWKNQDGKIIPVKNGEEIGFIPGQTWVNVIPTEPGIGHSVTVAND